MSEEIRVNRGISEVQSRSKTMHSAQRKEPISKPINESPTAHHTHAAGVQFGRIDLHKHLGHYVEVLMHQVWSMTFPDICLRSQNTIYAMLFLVYQIRVQNKCNSFKENQSYLELCYTQLVWMLLLRGRSER